MRRAAAVVVILVLVTLVAPSFAAGMPGPLGPVETRGPILITSNAAFTAANGVRSGAGTIGNPYVISGWAINAGSGTAITVKDVTAAFVIRDNLVEVSGTGTGILVESALYANSIVQNHVKFHAGAGIVVKTSNPTVRDNQITGSVTGQGLATSGYGIDLHRSSSLVTENTVSRAHTAVRATLGSPTIRGNNVATFAYGVHVFDGGARTNVTGNVIADGTKAGIRLLVGTNVSIYANLVEKVEIGIAVWDCLAVDVRSNYVHQTFKVGVQIEHCNMTLAANTIVDGVAGVQVWGSDAVVVGNNVSNHLQIGVEWMMSEGVMAENRIGLNAYGIYLNDQEVVRMRGNVLVNNRYGLHIPYVARQSIPYMQGNLVNGLNVDGTLVASERSFFYREANVVISGVTHDSGFSAGYYGAVSSQGSVTLYEVDTARVEASVISHGRIGVYAVNSFNVQVNASALLSNQIGVHLAVEVAAGIPVPPCVGFVKNTTITIPVDPPTTVGVYVRGGCVIGVFNNTISNVDVGIDVDAGTRGSIAGNVVVRTLVGMRIEGTASQMADVLIVADNRVEANQQGMVLIGSGATVQSNLVRFNTREGIKLELGAHVVLRANNVSANADGVVDATLCGAVGASCSRIVLGVGNTFYANARDGLVVNGGADLRGNAFIANGRHGFTLRGAATVRGAVAVGNGGDGGQALGTTVVADGNFSANGDDGLYVEGTATLRDVDATFNVQAGIRSNAVWVSAIHVNASSNFDGIVVTEGLLRVTVGPPSVPYPYVTVPHVSVPQPQGSLYQILGTDPMFIHRSIIEKNERNAIRSGAAVVNATYNYFGTPNHPGYDTGLTGMFGNTVSPNVHVTPWYIDRAMTTTAPMSGL